MLVRVRWLLRQRLSLALWRNYAMRVDDVRPQRLPALRRDESLFATLVAVPLMQRLTHAWILAC